MDDFQLELEFLGETDQDDHDLGFDFDAFLLDLDGGFDDGARLHLGDLREDDAQTAAAQAEHGVELMQLRHAPFDLLHWHAHLDSQVFLRRVFVGQEFMQRRVQGADGRRESFESAENSREVVALIGQKNGQGLFSIFQIVGEDHFAHGVDPIALEEHVLSAAQADAHRAKGQSVGRLFGGIGVGAHVHAGGFIAPLHQLRVILEGAALLGGKGLGHEHLDDL